MADCSCGLPEGAVVLNQLHIVEYLDPDGEIVRVDLSSAGDGDELPTGKMFELIGWAQMMAISPYVVDMFQEAIEDDDDDGGEFANLEN